MRYVHKNSTGQPWVKPGHDGSVVADGPYPTSPVIGFTALLSGNTAAASTASSSRR
jgi:hypothetical protein